jgi:hypothetical protein
MKLKDSPHPSKGVLPPTAVCVCVCACVCVCSSCSALPLSVSKYPRSCASSRTPICAKSSVGVAKSSVAKSARGAKGLPVLAVRACIAKRPVGAKELRLGGLVSAGAAKGVGGVSKGLLLLRVRGVPKGVRARRGWGGFLVCLALLPALRGGLRTRVSMIVGRRGEEKKKR